jgi:isoleucyl-tRNA synthetase
MQNFKELEEKILAKWKEEDAFKKSVDKRRMQGAKPFIFFEGPPTANGRPGIHHVLARAFKDIICRYKTMAGFLVERKAGWDTHGLPVELEVEKKLGLKSKKDIERYGIVEFNNKCKESVWTYTDEWKRLTERMGFWLDIDNPYITYDPAYMETLWWILKQVWDKGLLYQGYKVVPLCTRCGTGLSSHEVAQGYKKVKEKSVYVKFKLKPNQKIGSRITDEHSYILVWTTTPWTLPANVALAVGEDIRYSVMTGQTEGNRAAFILAEERETVLDGAVRESAVYGKDLAGLAYEPLYNTLSEKSDTAYKVYPADFVSTTDGTGVVHIAPMYGEDDYNLGQRFKLPNLHTVELDGTVKKDLGIPGEGKFAKEADSDIAEDLKRRDILLKTELYEHDYPFCWRCDTPLLYYAKPSWFIAVTKLRDQLIANNETINWVPEHIKEGRFGEWLREVKDWNFSRERYWGTPIPVWKCETCGGVQCVGTLAELDAAAVKSGNRFRVMRHGEADSNCMNIIHSRNDTVQLRSRLTARGEEQVRASAEKLKAEGLDLIMASPFERTAETAKIVAEVTGAKIVFDDRLVELNHGDYHGHTIAEYLAYYAEHSLSRFTGSVSGGETMNEVRARMMAVLLELDGKYKNKKILIISHGDPLLMLRGAVANFTLEEEFTRLRAEDYLKTGEFRDLELKTLPYDEGGNLNLHRPYADAIRLKCADEKCSGAAVRIKELADVWFDAGSMPFAQWHYLGKSGTPFDGSFPADYISEAIDQTRGWFYTLLAVSTLLGREAPFKNVISLAHVLDAKGQKMSKHVGNVVSPWDIIEKYGIDALRWYFFTVNEPGDYKLFDEKQVAERLRGFIGTFWNCVEFYKTYAEAGQNSKLKTQNFNAEPENSDHALRASDGAHVLDKWIFSRLNALILSVRGKLDGFDVTGSAREIEVFVVENLSQWYVRRSRERLQESAESMRVYGTVLMTVAKLSAPFIPFVADAAWRELQITNGGSVHLEDFPVAGKGTIDIKLEEDMASARKEIQAGLQQRAEKGIKIRQPLASFTAANTLDQDLLAIIGEELNVKKVIIGKENGFDWAMTPELETEGEARELVRKIQDARKRAGLKPGEEIKLFVGDKRSEELLKHPVHGPAIIAKTAVRSWQFEQGLSLNIERA